MEPITFIATLLLLLQYNRAGLGMYRLVSSGGNRTSSSGSGRTIETVQTLLFKDGVFFHVPIDRDSDFRWNMHSKHVNSYAKMFADVWEEKFNSLGGKPKDDFTVGQYEITLFDFGVDGTPSREIVEGPPTAWVKVVVENWAFCTKMKVRKATGRRKVHVSTTDMCLVPTSPQLKMVFQAFFDEEENENRQSNDYNNDLQLDVKHDPQLGEKLNDVLTIVLKNLKERWAEEIIYMSKMMNSKLIEFTGPQKINTAPALGMVKVRVSTSVQVLQ